MPSSNGCTRLENAVESRPDRLAVAAIEVPPLRVDALPAAVRHGRAKELAVLHMERRKLAGDAEPCLQRGRGALRQVVEPGAHAELPPGGGEGRPAHRHAERMDRTANRVGEVLGE